MVTLPPHSSHSSRFTCRFSLFLLSSISPLLFLPIHHPVPPVSFLTSLFLPFTRVTMSPFLFFSEREENVKTDIFAAYCALLSSTRIVTTTSQQQVGGASDTMETADTPLALLSTQVPALVTALSRQVRDKSPKTRLGCFTLLTSLVTVLPGALDDHMGVVLPGLLFSLT